MLIKRYIQLKIEDELFKGKVVILYGARQVGKTTLVKQIAKKYDGEYFNCEEPEIQAAFADKGSQDIRQFLGKGDLFVLDEAQSIENIGRKLKILVDAYPDLQIIATGSSSFELANQVVEPLTGRKITFMLYPLSVLELEQKYKEQDLRRRLDDFLRFGTYPEVVNKDYNSVENYIKEIAGSYLFRDIFRYKEVKSSEFLMKLLQALALQMGNEVSYTELANLLGADKKTIARYIDLFEKAFILFKLPPLSRNLRKELSKKRKIYFYDLGIRNSLINNFNQLDLRTDVGAIFENFFIVERMKKLSFDRQGYNKYFWRTHDQKEIDYVEDFDGILSAYELKWSPSKKVSLPKDFAESYEGSEFEIVNKENIFEVLRT
jgi:hypothetical protein